MGLARVRTTMGQVIYTDFYIASNEMYCGYIKVRVWPEKYLMNRRLSRRLPPTEYYIAFMDAVRAAGNVERLKEIFAEHDVLSLLERGGKKKKKVDKDNKKEKTAAIS